MDSYKLYMSQDFSINVCGETIPKNAIYGKTNTFFFYFADFSSMDNALCIIHMMEKTTGTHFRPYIMRTDSILCETLKDFARTHFGRNYKNTACIAPLCMNRDKKLRPLMREPQRTYTDMKNTAYQIKKQNADNCDYGGVGGSYEKPMRNSIKHDFSKYRPEVKKYNYTGKAEKKIDYLAERRRQIDRENREYYASIGL